jgi:hypothetical protein
LLAPLLLSWVERLRDAPELPKTVLASGLLAGEADRVGEAFGSLGFAAAKRLSDGEWAALVLHR